MKLDDIEIHETPYGLFAIRNLRQTSKREKDGTTTISFIAEIAGDEEEGRKYLEHIAFKLRDGFMENTVRIVK